MPSGQRRKKRTLPKLTRDGTLFLVGLALIINEAAFRSGPERPSLLVLFAAMVGAPFILRADEIRNHYTPPRPPVVEEDDP